MTTHEETLEQLLSEAVKSPDYLAVSGSRLYGTERENSDYDYRGFVIPPYEYVLDIVAFKDRELEENDHKVNSLKRYMQLVAKGDPQLTELLFVPKDKVVTCTEVGKTVLANRDLMVSQVIYKRIIGFGISEWRSAMLLKVEEEKPTKTEQEVMSEFFSLFPHFSEDQKKELKAEALKMKSRRLVSSVKGVSGKRKEEYEKFGFGVSSAAHSIRLMGELKELMLTGQITFPRPNSDFLRNIRLGKVAKDECESAYQQALSEVEGSVSKSVLRPKPDYSGMTKLYADLARDFIKNDKRFWE